MQGPLDALSAAFSVHVRVSLCLSEYVFKKEAVCVLDTNGAEGEAEKEKNVHIQKLRQRDLSC